jgi:hypothetical protein
MNCSTRDRRDWSLKRRLLATGLILTIVLPVAGCQRDHAGTTGVATAAPNEGSTTGAAPACTDSAVSNPASGDGSALQVEQASYTANDGQLNFVLPEQVRGDYPELKTGDMTWDSNALYERALADGAFVYGHPLIQLWLQNTTDGLVIISNLRAVNTRTVCLPTGLLALLGTQGGDPVQLAMNFDADRPVALVPSTSDNIPQTPYFTTQGAISLAPSDEPQQILVDGFLARQARTFDLAVTYTTDDGEFTQIIEPDGGGPFRVAPSVCPYEADQAALTDEDIDRFKAHRFTEVLRESTGTSSGGINMELVSHDDYMQACTTL